MNFDVFTVLIQRLNELDNAHNLLQIQINVLQSVLEKHYPELSADLDFLYSEKCQAYLKERDTHPLKSAAELDVAQSEPNE